MKYKSKFSADQKHFHTSYSMKIAEGESFTDVEGLTPGVFVFIPFTDERFFEPVKVQKFEVEMEEQYISQFKFLLGLGQYTNDDRWNVTEIDKPEWFIRFLDAYPDSSITNFTGIDPVWLKKNFYGKFLDGVKWLKDYTGKGLKSSKDLADFIWDNF